MDFSLCMVILSGGGEDIDKSSIKMAVLSVVMKEVLVEPLLEIISSSVVKDEVTDSSPVESIVEDEGYTGTFSLDIVVSSIIGGEVEMVVIVGGKVVESFLEIMTPSAVENAYVVDVSVERFGSSVVTEGLISESLLSMVMSLVVEDVLVPEPSVEEVLSLELIDVVVSGSLMVENGVSVESSLEMIEPSVVVDGVE